MDKRLQASKLQHIDPEQIGILLLQGFQRVAFRINDTRYQLASGAMVKVEQDCPYRLGS